jgi:hypothetical protein
VTPAQDPQRLDVLVHEVRSPVAALSAIAQTFSEDDIESPARLELSRLAITACLGIQRVVIDAAVASVQIAPVDIGALAHEVAATARLAGAPVRLELASDLRACSSSSRFRIPVPACRSLTKRGSSKLAFDWISTVQGRVWGSPSLGRSPWPMGES